MSEVVPLRPRSTRWQPDPVLVEAAMSGRLVGVTLGSDDRAWLVAVLTHRGASAEIIAAWLGISPRTVKTVRGEPVAVAVAFVLGEMADRRPRGEAPSPAAVARLLNEAERLRQARGVLIEQLAEMRRRCDTPCPDAVIVMRPPATRRRRPRVPELTIPLFPLESEGA